jgi:phospholipase/lecithinase/hemolysin
MGTRPRLTPTAFTAIAGLIGMLFSSTAGAAAPPVSGIVVFGDSLSDTGNAGAGRFSNGPVWVEHLAERLGTRLAPAVQGGTNFAVGGARTGGGPVPSLRAQVDRFLRAGKADGRALYVVYSGGNDLRAVVEAGDPVPALARAAESVGLILADLARAGAREFLVPNLPDVGRVPEIRRRGPQAVQAATALSMAYNHALDRVLDAAERRLPVRIHRLDVWALLEKVAADPRAAGFANITDACVTTPACRDADRYLFWDSVHPTAAAHARLAEAAYAALSDRDRQ